MTGPDAEPGAGTGLPPRIVLVGFMAAGKSTTGRRLARRVGYVFVDLDEEVERRAGRTIPEIFREDGEPAFRHLEAEVTRELDAVPGEAGLVVAAGGGWMARPELRDRWGDEAVRVWLRARPETVLARVGDDVASRPMLDPDDPEASVRELQARRRDDYARAELAVDTDDLSPGEVAARVELLLRRR